MRIPQTNQSHLEREPRHGVSQGFARCAGGKQSSANTQLAPCQNGSSSSDDFADQTARLPVSCTACNVAGTNGFGAWPIEVSPSRRKMAPRGQLRHAMCFPMDDSDGGQDTATIGGPQ